MEKRSWWFKRGHISASPILLRCAICFTAFSVTFLIALALLLWCSPLLLALAAAAAGFEVVGVRENDGLVVGNSEVGVGVKTLYIYIKRGLS